MKLVLQALSIVNEERYVIQGMIQQLNPKDLTQAG